MLVWFVTHRRARASRDRARTPAILLAVNPLHAVQLLRWRTDAHGFLVLGSVVLASPAARRSTPTWGTSAQRRSASRGSRRAPGAAAQLLRAGRAAPARSRRRRRTRSTCWRRAGCCIPLVVLATLAAIVASQALISGAFSLTQQAVQLGYLPRVTIVHTSSEEAGQIYIPEVNWLLMVGCLALVVGFQLGGALAAAYGIAVTGTMVITSFLFSVVARRRWGWPLGRRCGAYRGSSWSSISRSSAANLVKIAAWRLGPARAGARPVHRDDAPGSGARARCSACAERRRAAASTCSSPTSRAETSHRVPGHRGVHDVGSRRAPRSCCCTTSSTTRCCTSEVVLLSVRSRRSAGRAERRERVTVEPLGHGFFRVIATLRLHADAGRAARSCAVARRTASRAQPSDTSYYLGRERLIADRQDADACEWRKRLFAFMSRNARRRRSSSSSRRTASSSSGRRSSSERGVVTVAAGGRGGATGAAVSPVPRLHSISALGCGHADR